ncbi:hypothetical protein [Methanolobus vulcani]|nr:hypothetical protein [Methanolobus vulcani]
MGKINLDSEISRKCCIHEAVKDMFNFHWSNKLNIERKAASLIGFVGLIFTISAATFPNIDQNSQRGIILLLISFFFFILTIIASLSVLKMREWSEGYDLNYFMIGCELSAEKDGLLDYLIHEYYSGISKNMELNTHLSKYIQAAYYSFILGVLFVGIYIGDMLLKNW